MEFPLKLEQIEEKFKNIKSAPRNILDKNFIAKKTRLDCSFEHKETKDGNYVAGIDFEYQISPKKGVPFQKTRDLYGLIFLPESDLVILGRDFAIGEIIPVISKILYPDSTKVNVFKHIRFDTDSLVNTIKLLRKDDPNSWCDEYRGKHDAIKYEGRKTKSNFSLGEGSCILDDAEAIEAISVSTSINPTFKFYKCPKLNSKTYDTPKTIAFNGENGSISISIAQDFDNMYRFIAKFLVNELKW